MPIVDDIEFRKELLCTQANRKGGDARLHHGRIMLCYKLCVVGRRGIEVQGYIVALWTTCLGIKLACDVNIHKPVLQGTKVLPHDLLKFIYCVDQTDVYEVCRQD